MPRSPQTRTTPLTRAEAVDAAIALADERGLAAVTMRNLATELGVVPMALYKHVSDKDDLVGAMLDALIDQHPPPARDLGWRTGIRMRLMSARAVLAGHPWARRAIEARTTRTPAILRYMDTTAGIFMAAGFTPDLTHHVMHALGHRIWGFSPEAFDDPDSLTLPADRDEAAAMAAMVAREYPNVFAIAMSAGQSGCDEDFEFAFTLDLLLESFERLHTEGWRSPHSPKP